MRLFLGLFKGIIIGGGLGFGFMQLGSLGQSSLMQFLLYGLIGALVGFIAGKPFWRHDTIWTPVVKAVVGAIIGIGLFLLVDKAFGDPKLSFMGPGITATSIPWGLGAVVGILYGIFVEIDDGTKDPKQAKK